MLIEYYRKPGSRIKRGVMVAIPNMILMNIDFGYSLCHLDLDKFDKNRGLGIAIDRAAGDRPIKIPHSMKKAFSRFQTRCERYYKQFNVY